MDSVILTLPREGQLVTVPLLTAAGLTYGVLTLGTGTAATTTVTLSSAAITYADLRVLGFVAFAIAQTATGATWGFDLNSAQVNGDIQLVYGACYGQVTIATTTQSYGRLFVPGLRDNSLLEKNSRISTRFTSRQTGGVKLATTIIINAMAVCERVSDPKAERY